MDFVAIDFETANNSRSSICSVGLVKYQNGILVDEMYRLVKPFDDYFDPYNTYIHGITYNDVKNEPEFDIIWKDLYQHLNGRLILAHNASFDMSVLRHSLDHYSIPCPDLSYNCTRNIAKKTWPGRSSYKLTDVCTVINYQFNHHHALEDAHAAATIYLKAFEYLEVDSYEELVDKLSISTGELFTGGYKPARMNKNRSSTDFNPSSLKPVRDVFDETHPFYNMSIVFTGTLQSMRRKDAMQKVVNVGGHCEKGITKETNFLVIGDQDFNRFADGKRSSKLAKAETLIANGQELEIIPESDFLELL